MPLYDYRCENGHTFEVMQRMSEDPLTECTECGAPVRRLLHPPAVHFKGSGFYTTDYGRKKTGGSSGSSEESGSSSSSSDSKKSDSKSDSGSSSGSGSGSGSGSKAESKSSSSSD
jgi:putative FmdB family regulatory protein